MKKRRIAADGCSPTAVQPVSKQFETARTILRNLLWYKNQGSFEKATRPKAFLLKQALIKFYVSAVSLR